jgi:uncharacterized iron-regulated membrane protein
VRKFHRWIAVFAVVAGLYYGTTGIVMQLMDLRALLNHAPATDPTMQAMRVGINGPPNFQVISEPDYAAQPLPPGFDFDTALATILQAGRSALGNAPFSYIDIRVQNGRPVGQIASGGRLFGFDAVTSASLGAPQPVIQPPLSLPSLRNTVKDYHRLRIYGRWALAFDLVVAAALLTLIATGMVLYFQLLRARGRLGKYALYWSGGGIWRSLHRLIGLIAALLLSVVALSGSVLAASSLGVAIRGGVRPGLTADVSAPLPDANLPAMLHTGVTAQKASNGNSPVKLLRLRFFAGMPQVVFVWGDDDVRQTAFNADTGRVAGLSEPGYPDPGVLFGWNVTQTAKRIHRGDVIGLSGRWMDLLTGAALLYLSVSGVIMYVELWRKRQQRGLQGFFWP